MNRVRMGLTGLAFIFLIVVIAAVGRWPFAESSAPKAEEETLATLGVAPGAEENSEPPPPAPPTVLNTPPLDMPQVQPDQLVIDEHENLTEI